jgi:cardiolipin synthase
VVGDIGRLFRRTWLRAGGAPDVDPVRDPAPISERGSALVECIDNYGRRSRGRMHRDYRYAISRAVRSVHIMNAYFIPDRRLRRELQRAVERGADVRVIVPGPSDVPIVKFASRYLYSRLLQAGIKIHEYQGTMMHAKCGVIDGVWSTCGSHNLDVRSMLHNLEAGVVCLSEGFARSVEAEFERQLRRCREIRPETWGRRPWWNLVLEWVSYRFRYWL